MSLLAPLLALAATGCISYTPGSFRSPFGGAFPGVHSAIGCLDLALAQRFEPIARGPVIEYSFGNRCVSSVTVDLATAPVVVRRYGRDEALLIVDPRREVRALPLDGRWAGHEQIEYDGPRSMDEVCVDISRIDGEARPMPEWVCAPLTDVPQ